MNMQRSEMWGSEMPRSDIARLMSRLGEGDDPVKKCGKDCQRWVFILGTHGSKYHSVALILNYWDHNSKFNNAPLQFLVKSSGDVKKHPTSLGCDLYFLPSTFFKKLRQHRPQIAKRIRGQHFNAFSCTNSWAPAAAFLQQQQQHAPPKPESSTLQPAAAPCSLQQHPAACSSTLQPAAAPCSLQQHPAAAALAPPTRTP